MLEGNKRFLLCSRSQVVWSPCSQRKECFVVFQGSSGARRKGCGRCPSTQGSLSGEGRLQQAPLSTDTHQSKSVHPVLFPQPLVKLQQLPGALWGLAGCQLPVRVAKAGLVSSCFCSSKLSEGHFSRRLPWPRHRAALR